MIKPINFVRKFFLKIIRFYFHTLKIFTMLRKHSHYISLYIFVPLLSQKIISIVSLCNMISYRKWKESFSYKNLIRKDQSKSIAVYYNVAYCITSYYILFLSTLFFFIIQLCRFFSTFIYFFTLYECVFIKKLE